VGTLEQSAQAGLGMPGWDGETRQERNQLERDVLGQLPFSLAWKSAMFCASGLRFGHVLWPL